MLKLFGRFAIGVIVALPTVASATVRYYFATTSPLASPVGLVDFTTPTRVSSGITKIAAGDVTACDLAPPMSSFTCLPPALVSYDAQDITNNDVFNFRVRDPQRGITTYAFYFAAGAFQSLGTAYTVRLNPFQSARLTILPGVPEPSTWAEMITGLIAVGAAARIRRRRHVAPDAECP